MWTSLFFVLAIIATTNAANCPANRNALCSNVLKSQGCGNYYQFYFNAQNVPLNLPVTCVDNPNTAYCKDSTTSCTPRCSVGGKYSQLSGSCLSFPNPYPYVCPVYRSITNEWCFTDPSTLKCISTFNCYV